MIVGIKIKLTIIIKLLMFYIKQLASISMSKLSSTEIRNKRILYTYFIIHLKNRFIVFNKKLKNKTSKEEEKKSKKERERERENNNEYITWKRFSSD